MAAETVSLTEAAFTLGLTYNATLKLVLTHRLKGRQVRGKWLVDKADTERLRKAQQSESP